MQKSNVLITSFANGEVSPRMYGREDLESFKKSLTWCQNAVPLPQGPATNRCGTYFCGLTINNGGAVLIEFQFNANDAVMIVATDKKFRFYRNDAVVLNTSTAITAVSKANPCVVTSPSHGLATGQEVYITSINGTKQINSNFYIVTVVDANNVSLKDQFGNAIDSTNFDTYISGGTIASIYSLDSPYFLADLPYIRYAQVGDVMYITCRNPVTGVAYEPRKLTRTNFTSWTIATFARTNDQLTPTYSQTISGATQANPCQLTVFTTTGLSAGNVILVSGVVGMTQLNGNFYTVKQVVDATHITLADLSGNSINSTGYSAYTSGGTVTTCDTWPALCSFTGDGRLAYASSAKFPQGWWASRLPNGATTRYDDQTTGSTADYALVFQFAPVNGQVDNIQEMVQFSGNFALLGASSILQVYGAQPGQPATINAINTTPTITGTARIRPLVINWDLIFVDVDQKSIKGLQYNLAFNNYSARDYTIDAEHLGLESNFTKMIFTKGPQAEIIWVLREDGSLLGLTFNNIESVFAWSRHYFGGSARVIDIGKIRRAGGYDELWLVVQRTMNGQTYTSIEVMAQWPVFPLRKRFYTNDETTDKINYASASWEAAKSSCFLDMSFAFDGTARGVAANASLSLSGAAAVGSTINVTASAAVFQDSDVGQQLWKNYISDGTGGGQATITQVTSSTTATLYVTAAFNDLSTLAPGKWAFAVNRLTNLGLFNGQTLGVQTDGGAHPVKAVSNGRIDLQWFASNVKVGFNYMLLMATISVDPQTRSGPAANKIRNIARVRCKFDNTCGGFIGVSEYRLFETVFRNVTMIANRIPTPFTGTVDTTISDMWQRDDRYVVFKHSDPSPWTLINADVELVTVG